MITKYAGGNRAKGGIYWNETHGEFASIPSEGGTLAGEAEDRYIRIPLPLVMVLGPAMGLFFVILLPLSGLLVLVPFLIARMRNVASSGRITAAQMAAPHAQPGVSYLEARFGSRPDSEVSEDERKGELIDLAREIAKNRWQEK